MRQVGLTLLEMLIVTSILAILLAIGLSSYGNLIKSSRLSKITSEMVAALAYARSESLKRGIRVSLCKTANAMSNSPSCQTTATWNEGWLIYTDAGTIGVLDGADQVLKIRAEPVVGITVTVSNFTNYVSYLPTGRSRAPNGLSNGSINFCSNGERRSVVLNITGRVRTASGTC